VEVFLSVTPDCSLRLLGVKEGKEALYANGFGSYSAKEQKTKVELLGISGGRPVEL